MSRRRMMPAGARPVDRRACQVLSAEEKEIWDDLVEFECLLVRFSGH